MTCLRCHMSHDTCQQTMMTWYRPTPTHPPQKGPQHGHYLPILPHTTSHTATATQLQNTIISICNSFQIFNQQAEKLKSREMKEGWMKNDEVWMKDEWRMMKDEGWMMKDDDFKLLRGFASEQTDRRTDICECRVAFATENYTTFFCTTCICRVFHLF